jgi:glutamine synthetase
MAEHMPQLNTGVLDKYMALPQGTRVQAEYVWIGGSGQDLRSKTMTLEAVPKSVADLRIWNFDGSSTGQAPGHDSEVLLKPVAIFPDPFRGAPNILVMCECYEPGKNGGEMTAIPSNTRAPAKEKFDKALGELPWFGLEQEYTLFNKDKKTPLGWPRAGYPGPQGPYYCSVGAENSFGRPVVEAHYRACLYAGITISGVNGEVLPGQWEYQIGPCLGISSGDHSWMARYIMYRVCEDFGVCVSFDPKPISGDWNGSGMHTNFSTKTMREDGGWDAIIKAVEKLGKKHKEHIEVYGEGNARRLTGHHETASIHNYSYGVANRGASCRIPRDAEKDKKGYFEDRRPAANADPYVVTSKIFETTCL